MTVRRTRVLAAIASVGLVVGLAACTTGGGAVESLGVTYSENDVTVTTDQLVSLLGDGAVTRQNVVAMMSQIQPFFTIAEEQGLAELTDESLNEAAQSILTQLGVTAEVSDLSHATRDMLAAQALSSVISEAASADEALNAEIVAMMSQPNTSINPRYLTMTSQGLVAAGTLGDVVDQAQSSSSAE